MSAQLLSYDKPTYQFCKMGDGEIVLENNMTEMFSVTG